MIAVCVGWVGQLTAGSWRWWGQESRAAVPDRAAGGAAQAHFPGWASHCHLQGTRYAMLCYAMPCYAMPCYAMLCYAMLRYATLRYADPSARLSSLNSEQWQTALRPYAMHDVSIEEHNLPPLDWPGYTHIVLTRSVLCWVWQCTLCYTWSDMHNFVADGYFTWQVFQDQHHWQIVSKHSHMSDNHSTGDSVCWQSVSDVDVGWPARQHLGKSLHTSNAL